MRTAYRGQLQFYEISSATTFWYIPFLQRLLCEKRFTRKNSCASGVQKAEIFSEVGRKGQPEGKSQFRKASFCEPSARHPSETLFEILRITCTNFLYWMCETFRLQLCSTVYVYYVLPRALRYGSNTRIICTYWSRISSGLRPTTFLQLTHTSTLE